MSELVNDCANNNLAPILIVDDDNATLTMLGALLQVAGFETRLYSRGRAALEALSNEAFALAILDIQMPDVTGLELLKTIRERRLDLPVIVVSGDQSIDSAIEALRWRAFDFVRKPINPVQLVDTINRALIDTSTAFRDPLTSLPNRALLADRVRLCISQSERNNTLFGLLFVDLDGFKSINDQFGHMVGDQALREVAARFTSVLRRGDTLARIGGDEFVLMLPQIDDRAGALSVAEKLHHVLLDAFAVPGGTATLACSIGCAIFPADGATLEVLLAWADSLMYQQKNRRRANLTP